MFAIGYLTEFIITRALPDHESYLVFIISSGTPALLPKKYAIKQYKVGETGWATIFTTDRTYTILSQRAPQYIRKILEYLINDELIKTGMKICHVAKAESSNQYKVAVKGDGDVAELYSQTRHLKETFTKYIQGSVYFIKYSSNREEYVKNALLPGSRDKIQKVIYRKELNQVDVYVDSSTAGIFLGKRGSNVASASKLTGLSIQIIPI